MSVSRRNMLGGMLLVMVAVGGLLSMHGLDGVVASLSEPSHETHMPGTSVSSHVAFGICVFVTVVAGLAVGAIRVARRKGALARFTHRAGIAPWLFVPAPPGRSRLFELCVLRL